jgi:glucose/arabinose dehydrogenase
MPARSSRLSRARGDGTARSGQFKGMHRIPLTLLLLLPLALAPAACASDDDGGSRPATPTGASPPAGSAATRTIATGLQVPWGIAFLPGGDALVAERTTARIKRIPAGGGRARTVMRVPGVDVASGEGGLLGLAISPSYRRDRLVYAYYTSARDNRIVRFRLGGRATAILTGLRRGFNHDGGRIAFGPDGKLYAGVGDATESDLAQDRAALNGKILRMNPDGSVPAGNPFGNSLVWSMGHRNLEGLAWDRAGRLWATEFGENRFDEVNLIRPGRNYGWPVVEGRGSTHGGLYTNPLVTWTTAEASPSGAAIVGSTLYVAALRGEASACGACRCAAPAPAGRAPR